MGTLRKAGTVWRLLLLVALAGAVRLAVAETTFPVALNGDEPYYVSVATSIARGHGHVDGTWGSRAAWPPAHPYLLSFFADSERHRPLVQADLRPLVRCQVALGTLIVLFTALLGRALFDARVGEMAGLASALYPTLVAYSHYLWAENLFVVLALAGLVLAVRCEGSRGPAWAVAAGLLFGLAALAREEALLLAGACGLWWVVTAGAQPGPRSRLRAAGLALCMFMVAATVIAPWAVRNYRLYERVVPVSLVGWMALREGNTLDPEHWLSPDYRELRRFRKEYFSIPDELERMEFARAQALDRIRAEQPAWIARKLLLHTALLFQPDSFLFRKLHLGSYGDVGLGWVRWLLLAAVLSYLAVVVSAVAGAAAAREGGRRLLAVLVVGSVTGLHVLANASSRYRLVLMPLFIVYASHAWVHRERALAALRGRRAWIPVALLAFFLGFCVPYFHDDAISLWADGTYTDTGRLRPR